MKIISKIFLGLFTIFLIVSLSGYFLFIYANGNITAKVISSEANLSNLKINSLSIVFFLVSSFILIITTGLIVSLSIMKPLEKIKTAVSERNEEVYLSQNNEFAGLANEINKRIKYTEKEYKEILDNANDLIQSVDKDCNFIYVNKKWKEIMGYSEEDIKSLSLLNILKSDQKTHCMDLFKKVCAGEHLENVNTIFISKNKKEIFVEGNISPKITNGKFISTIGIFRDVTEKKQVEKEIEKLNKLMIGREVKMSELKKEIKELKK
ncbi:hypothetical protein A3K73_05575 [Candidatus Pacearchaeota archaeon RBG_13_36_9]|nr:MAG: hypothetical protein A3K73_05575 [Candidatus Pacearchaeota archaeon RBG_13_36_9]